MHCLNILKHCKEILLTTFISVLEIFVRLMRESSLQQNLYNIYSWYEIFFAKGTQKIHSFESWSSKEIISY